MEKSNIQQREIMRSGINFIIFLVQTTGHSSMNMLPTAHEGWSTGLPLRPITSIRSEGLALKKKEIL